jgi:hypothetical protein
LTIDETSYTPEGREVIQSLRSHSTGDELAFQATWGTITGRIEEVEDEGDEYWALVKPTDGQQVRECSDFDSLDDLTMGVPAEADEYGHWLVLGTLSKPAMFSEKLSEVLDLRHCMGQIHSVSRPDE